MDTFTTSLPRDHFCVFAPTPTSLVGNLKGPINHAEKDNSLNPKKNANNLRGILKLNTHCQTNYESFDIFYLLLFALFKSTIDLDWNCYICYMIHYYKQQQAMQNRNRGMTFKKGL